MKKLIFTIELVIFILLIFYATSVNSFRIDSFNNNLTSETIFLNSTLNATRYISIVQGASFTNATFNVSSSITFDSTYIDIVPMLTVMSGMTRYNDLYYVSSWASGIHRVEKFNLNGSYNNSNFSIQSQNTDPVGITYCVDGFYLVDSDDDTVTKYNLSGSYVTAFAVAGATGQLGGITCNLTSLFIEDSGVIYNYNLSGTFTGYSKSVLSTTGINNIGMSYYNDYFYIGSDSNSKIYEFNKSLDYTGRNLDISGKEPWVVFVDNIGLFTSDSTGGQNDISRYNIIQNINVTVNYTQIYFSGGILNQTNTVNNFASVLNAYLPSCTYTNGFCQIPINYNSKTQGYINYLNMIIDANESIKPNLTIYSPNQSYDNLTYIPLNFTARDNYQLDKCWYNITIGATLDTANTEINCSQNTTVTVSFGDGNYLLRMCVNDTSGNMNCSTSGFVITNYVAPPTIIQGGGGGSTPNTFVNVSLFSSSFGNKIDVVLPIGSVKERLKQIIIVNTELTPVQVQLECVPSNGTGNIDICSHVTFSEKSIIVSPNEIESAVVDMVIEVPEEAVYEDQYNFYVIARTNGAFIPSAKLSVATRFPVYASILKWSYLPLQDESLEDSEKLRYPVSLAGIFFGFIGFSLTIIIFRKTLPTMSIFGGALFSILIYSATIFIL